MLWGQWLGLQERQILSGGGVDCRTRLPEPCLAAAATICLQTVRPGTCAIPPNGTDQSVIECKLIGSARLESDQPARI